ncbi:TPA: hypothetical protein ACG6BA_005419, partial [Escherichia coli]
EYDDVLSQYDGAKYLYPSSFALDDDNNIYIQYIFEPKQKDNILVCYNKKGNYLGYYKIPSGGRGGAGEGLAIIQDYNGFNVVYVVSNTGTLQRYNMVSSLYGDRLFKERDFSINAFNQFSMSQDYWLIEGYESERSIKYSR